MPRRTDSADAFLLSYPQEYPKLEEASKQAEYLIGKLLRDHRSDIHLISSRAKDPDSTLWKIRRKGYTHPLTQLTDVIAVRVIAYYQSDVDPIVEKLVQEFEIDPTKSVDKRQALTLRAFGYRSVHLVARLQGFRATSPEYAALAGKWFEVQVRSILEHAWAEIEHEVVYKSGIKFPPQIERRFAAIAGTLELIEKEFLALRGERDELIDRYRRIYDSGLDGRTVMDSARLLALLESEWPRNPSWRSAEKRRKPFPLHIEDRCVGALGDAKLKTADSLRRVFGGKRFGQALRKFADSELKSTAQISHLAIVVLAIAVKNFSTLRRYFPEFADVSLVSALKRRRTRRRKTNFAQR